LPRSRAGQPIGARPRAGGLAAIGSGERGQAMREKQLDWSSPYVVPARLRFRLTPAGKLRVVDERTPPGSIGSIGSTGSSGPIAAVEVEGEHVELLLGFASPQVVEAAFEQAAESWDIDRETYGRLVESWILLGLLRRAETGAHATTRLALFAEAIAEQ